MNEYIKPSVEVVAFDNKENVLLVSGLSTTNSNEKFKKNGNLNEIQLP